MIILAEKLAKIQDMTIAKTMVMGYDLKMFDKEEDANKEAVFPDRHNTEGEIHELLQCHQQRIKEKILAGNELTEWKYQRYMKTILPQQHHDRNIGRTLDYPDKHGLTNKTIIILFEATRVLYG